MERPGGIFGECVKGLRPQNRHVSARRKQYPHFHPHLAIFPTRVIVQETERGDASGSALGQQAIMHASAVVTWRACYRDLNFGGPFSTCLYCLGI
jgi:hypothetical protein